MLSDDDFRQLIHNAPLVAIDLVVESQDGQILLGERLNRPAQGFWFVPGGRIHKGETIDLALARISASELGVIFTRDQGRLLGVYDHLYQDSVYYASHPEITTQYVVMCYHFMLKDRAVITLNEDQHGRYEWFAKAALTPTNNVHANSITYLQDL